MSQNILFKVEQFEIIAKVIERTTDKLVVSYPMVLHPVNVDGGLRLDMYQYSLATPDSNHTFNTALIISTANDIPKMLEDAYVQRTTGLIISGAVESFAGL